MDIITSGSLKMSIVPVKVYFPHPNTTRGKGVHLSYDSVHNRIAFGMGKSVFVQSVDPSDVSKNVQFSKHTFGVSAVSFSPSGNYVASGDESGNVKIWDSSLIGKSPETSTFEQPAVKSEFQVLSGPIRSIAWDSDNNRIIAVGEGKDKFGHCFLWDSGNSVGEIQGHSSAITAVSIKPNRPYRAATVGQDNSLVFYTGPPFKFDKSSRDKHTNTVRDVKFSPDGKWLVSVGSDKAIVFYDGKTGEFIRKVENAHLGGIYSLSWFEDSSKFVTASADKTMKIWNSESAEAISTLDIESAKSVSDQLVSVVVTKEFIISLSLDGSFNYFTKDDYSFKYKIKGHQQPITKISKGEDALYSGSSDGKLFKWDIVAPTYELSPIPSEFCDSVYGHANYVQDIVSNDGKVLSIGWDDKIKLWQNQQLIASAVLSGQPKMIVFSNGLLVVLFESKIETYSVSSKEIQKNIEQELNFSASCMHYIESSKTLLVTNCSELTISEFKVNSDNLEFLPFRFPKFRSTPSFLRISPDDKFVAISDALGKYDLYNIEDATLVTKRWAFHTSKVTDCKWSPDSKYLLSVGLDCSIYIYSAVKPSKVIKFSLAHQGGVSAVEWLNYNSESKTASFLTGGVDGTIKSWNVEFE